MKDPSDRLSALEADGQLVEKAVDAQCFILKVCKLLILAFRGSQPMNFFDWALNFQIVGPLGNNKTRPTTLHMKSEDGMATSGD